ncbi:MAG TPA: hypothetical protein DD791_08070 [Syntrophomonas sp.]|jgi:hypothetical protein|nr:hypothetical protein [Syntrophomonas sp.]
MQKRILLATLIILIILWFTRWDVAASKTYNNGVAHWKHDTWTGAVIAEKYFISWPGNPKVDKKTVRKGIVPSNTATSIWFGLLLVNSAWLLYVIKKEGDSSAN